MVRTIIPASFFKMCVVVEDDSLWQKSMYGILVEYPGKRSGRTILG